MQAGEGGDVTQLLVAWKEGDDAALNRLMPLVYAELHSIAARHLRNERAADTFQTTALIHEAYMRLVGADVEWDGRQHFLAIASRTMRRVLVDHARTRSRAKRGGGHVVSVTLSDAMPVDGDAGPDRVDVLALDQALEKLEAFDERKAKVVELHHFGGLSYDEVAQIMGISPATVHRELRMARAWLYKELNPD
jgi:RNA polymerase sigma factor (TIGR02999 family)